jgi:ABC-type glycerol-3-phosphate transport system permease component
MPVISEVTKNKESRVALALVYILATAWLIAMLFPLYYTVVMATAPRAATIEVPPRLTIGLAKVAWISLDLTPFVKANLNMSRSQLESAMKGEIAVAATRPLFLNRELEATHIIASFNGDVIAEAEIPQWQLTNYYNYWLNTGAAKPRAEGDKFFKTFNIPFNSDVLDGKTTYAPAWYNPPAAGSLGDRVLQQVQQEGEVNGNWSLTIKGSVNHMLDGFRLAMGPKDLWLDFTKGSVPRWFFNSLVYAFGVIVLQLSVSALAGYALSRLWPRKLAYWLELFFLATMMLPAILLFLPLFLMMQNFPLPTIPFTSIKLPGVNLMNTYWSMFLPHAAWAFSILLFRGFFDQLPDELFQAARIDGATELKIFTGIVFPLSGPVYATMTIFTFMAIWAEFLWPYLVANKQFMWTLSIGLFSASGAGGSSGGDPRMSMSMALIAAIPPLFIFAFFQRYLVRGIAMTGLKG